MKNLNKTQKRILIVAIVLVIGIIGYYVYGKNTQDVSITNEEMLIKPENTNEETSKDKIIVHITGAVKKEGIVTLAENSRIADAVNAAGGLTDDADMSKINLAYILEDGTKIKIPSKNDVEQNTEEEQIVEAIPESDIKSVNSQTGKVNINKATQSELETLPGIGPSIALKIVTYREENGKFSSIEDLKKVSGIGENKFDNIKDFISVK